MTTIINLDEITAPNAIEITLFGKSHKLQIATVDSFLENMKDLETLKVDATAEEQTNVGLRIIGRAFPSIDKGDLRKLNLYQLNKLRDLAREANDEVRAPDGEAKDEGNDSKAS